MTLTKTKLNIKWSDWSNAAKQSNAALMDEAQYLLERILSEHNGLPPKGHTESIVKGDSIIIIQKGYAPEQFSIVFGRVSSYGVFSHGNDTGKVSQTN